MRGSRNVVGVGAVVALLAGSIAACAAGDDPTPTAARSCSGVTPGVHEIVLTGGGADHPVRVFVPSAFAGEPLPAVIGWHGLGGDGAQQAASSGYEQLAEEQGFLAVHPTGVGDDGGPASWQLVPGDGDRDDLAFADVLLDTLVADWCADAARIYSTGFSNGGFFTARLVCERADRIAAAVSVAGLHHPDDCTPARAVPYLAYHGNADEVVPYDGGPSVLDGPGVPADLLAVLGAPIHDEFDEFAADAGCDPAPNQQYIGVEVLVSNYTGCEIGDMAFFEVLDGGHTWPGSPTEDAAVGVDDGTTGIVEATRDGWVYMRQFRLEG